MATVKTQEELDRMAEVVDDVIDLLDEASRKLRTLNDAGIDAYVTDHIGRMNDEASHYGGAIARLKAHLEGAEDEARDYAEELAADEER
jgi:uncharacterized protein Yka (UPF0111/DUF47 family)